MLELYRSIYTIGTVVWKVLSRFSIRCIYTQPVTIKKVKFDIILYDSGARGAGECRLVDFKMIKCEDCSLVFVFFDVCGKIVTELAVSG